MNTSATLSGPRLSEQRKQPLQGDSWRHNAHLWLRRLGLLLILLAIIPWWDSDRLPISHSHGFNAQTIQVGRWVLDTDTMEFRADENLTGMHGAARQVFHGTYESFVSTLSPGDRVKATEGIRRAITTRRPYVGTFQVRWADGPERTLLMVVNLSKDESRAVGICLLLDGAGEVDTGAWVTGVDGLESAYVTP